MIVCAGLIKPLSELLGAEMILETVKDLIDEYKRRLSESCGYCENCNVKIRRPDRFKVTTCRKVFFVPGTNYQTLPCGWGAATCRCGKEFSPIEYEDVETAPPCDCGGCKK